MVGKSFVSQLAITLRRKVLAAAIVYAISVIVHLTSPVGAGTEIPTHSAPRTNPLELRNTIHLGHSAGGGNALTAEKSNQRSK